jgi:hypothetical protein
MYMHNTVKSHVQNCIRHLAKSLLQSRLSTPAGEIYFDPPNLMASTTGFSDASLRKIPRNSRPERCARRKSGQTGIYAGMFPKNSPPFSGKQASNVSAHGFCLASRFLFCRLHHSLAPVTSSAARGSRSPGACKVKGFNPTMWCQRRQAGSGGPPPDSTCLGFRSNGFAAFLLFWHCLCVYFC